jgi:5-methylcytosine-specific restriction endonuclease McrA
VTKFCRYCQHCRPLSDFTVRRASPDGLSYKCRECGASYNRNRYSTNDSSRAAAKARARRWSTANRERRREIVRRSDEKHLQRKRLSGRAYNRRARTERPEIVRLIGRIAANARRSRCLNAGPMPSASIISTILSMARCRCIYCGAAASLTLDHVRPLSGGGTNRWDNFIPCCKSCNSSKATKEAAEWIHSQRGVVGLANALVFMKSVRKAMRRLYDIEILET